MMNFDELEFVDKVETKVETRVSINGNYVIGADPFDQEEGSVSSTFSVYDKRAMRKTTTMKTTRTFDWFVDLMLKNELVKDFVISKKFINDTGRAKKYSEIRSESNGFKRDNTTQLS